MSEIETKNFPLLEKQEVKTIDQNSVLVLDGNSEYLLKNPHIVFSYDESKKNLSLSYVKKNKRRFKIEPVIKTWTQKLKERTVKEYNYKVEIHYKHFPIIVDLDTSDLKNQKVTIQNFYGCKSSFILYFSKLEAPITYDKNKKVLSFRSYDDVVTGNELEAFNKLRYKTNLKNLDRNVFTDGFYIKKYIKDRAEVGI